MARSTGSTGGRFDTPPYAQRRRTARGHAATRGPDARGSRPGAAGRAAQVVDDDDDGADADEERTSVVFRYRLEPEAGLEFVSDSVLGVCGYSPGELYADPYLAYAIVHPDDLPLLLQLDPVSDANRPLLLRWVRRDLHVIWTRHLHAPVVSEDGRVVGVEGVARDVTALVLAELGIEQPRLPRDPARVARDAGQPFVRDVARDGAQPVLGPSGPAPLGLVRGSAARDDRRR